MGAIEIKYFNSFILRKTLGVSGDVPVWNGSRGDNTYGNPSYVDPSAKSLEYEVVITMYLMLMA